MHVAKLVSWQTYLHISGRTVKVGEDRGENQGDQNITKYTKLHLDRWTGYE